MWCFLFDLDGTILDTTELILQSFEHAFREGLGQSVPREELLRHFGRPLVEQFQIMCPDLEDSERQRLVDLYLAHNEGLHDQYVSVVPGAPEGLERLYQAGYPLGIVTSKRENLTVQGLRLFGLDRFFQVIVHMDSTRRHKPHPEPVLHALHLLGGLPQCSAYVGDSPYDMRAGRAAGVRTVGILYNTFTADVLREAGADVIATSWTEVVDILLGWAHQPEFADLRQKE
ncbi:MAG: HAD-IA family hydrolase [Firmicutes bacterium]|nr:HAD-IA family hydrolase [Bacillota bacterium]